MNLALLEPDIQRYLLEHIHDNAAAFALRKHPFTSVTTQELTQQLVGFQKAKSKFPSFFDNPQIVYPPKVNLEQTSSWTAAMYKAALIKGDYMVDITGGFGVDVSAFAKAYKATTHVELNESLQLLAKQLFKAQRLATKSVAMDGMEFLAQATNRYDLIYIDPSRKTEASTKAVMLEDYEPRVMDYMDLLFSRADTIMVKTSPMLDITAGLQSLKHVSELHVVAIKNEVKELLWILKKNHSLTKVTAVNLESSQPVFKLTELVSNFPISYTEPLKYLYEPNAAVMKTMAFQELCKQYPVSKIDQDAHLFTSDELLDFPGRTFEIKAVNAYKPKAIKKQYGSSERAVVTRNFRESVAQLRKKYKLTENETDYLFFTSIAGNYVIIEAVKI